MKKGYKKISSGMVEDGDYLRIEIAVYDRLINTKVYQNHFSNRIIYGKIIRFKSSSFSVYVKLSDGSKKHFSLTEENITVYRKE